jgi:hypothetical protein
MIGIVDKSTFEKKYELPISKHFENSQSEIKLFANRDFMES